MLAILVLSALMGLALGDPLPPVKKHTEIIHVPAPKPVVRKVPALQEHARIQVQHVPIRQTVVKQVNVPRDIVREVPVIVEKKLILKQPQIRRFPIDVQKTLLQPHIKHVPQVRVNYRKRPYDVWHTKEVKKIINVPRPVPVIKHKIITKVLNRIVDVPHKVYKDRVKVVQVPQPFKVQKVHHRKVDVPIEVRVPVPRVHIKQTHEVQKVPIDVTVVKKVAIPRKTTLTEIVPVPVKKGGGYNQYDDSVGQLNAFGAFANAAVDDDGASAGALADASAAFGGAAGAVADASSFAGDLAQALAGLQGFNDGNALNNAFLTAQSHHGGAGIQGIQGVHGAHGVQGFQGINGALNDAQAFTGAQTGFADAGAVAQASAAAQAQAQAAAIAQAQAQAAAYAQAQGQAQAAAFAQAQGQAQLLAQSQAQSQLLAQAQAQAQAQTTVLGQSQNFINAQANDIQSDLQLANQLSFDGKYDLKKF